MFIFRVPCVTVPGSFLAAVREEIARQRSVANYRKLHEAGKTEEAQRDLARLAIIRQKREEAAKKKEEELKGQSSRLFYCVGFQHLYIVGYECFC